VLAFGDELLDLQLPLAPVSYGRGGLPGGRELAAPILLPRAEAALLPGLHTGLPRPCRRGK
jgi:hypothetical protein